MATLNTKAYRKELQEILFDEKGKHSFHHLAAHKHYQDEKYDWLHAATTEANFHLKRIKFLLEICNLDLYLYETEPIPLDEMLLAISRRGCDSDNELDNEFFNKILQVTYRWIQ